MFLPFPQSPPSWQLVADIVFTVLFALEMSLKLAALGLRLYFKDAWNWLDAIVVVEVGATDTSTACMPQVRSLLHQWCMYLYLTTPVYVD